jgi:ornithine carbamoyltransferase
MKHLLSIESLTQREIYEVLDLADTVKAGRHSSMPRPLAGQCWALIFSKSSTRTRVSFEVGIRELGGDVMFLSANDIQLGRGEPIEDTARVMGRMLGGAVIRTYRQSDVEVFAEYSQIPTVNALTDDEHPCQILADLQTIREKTGGIEGRSLCFVGDGACNVARSWVWAAARLGFELRIAAPKGFQPDEELLSIASKTARILVTEDVREAARGADVLYTDVWVSMGKEDEAAPRLAAMAPYQINEELVGAAAPGALVMHCLPAYRGKEISAQTFEAHAKTLFDQAENRLHAQKAVLRLIAANR